MKFPHILSLFLFCFYNTLLIGQLDTVPKSEFIQGNNIRAGISSNGSLFWTPEEGNGQFYHKDDPAVSIAQFGGFWASGLDPGGNLKGNIMMTPRGDQHDFIPGLLSKEGNPIDFNGVWKASREDIEAHKADFADNGVIDQKIEAIWAWPGYGNPNFEEYNDFPLPDLEYSRLAPFWDVGGTLGIYEPQFGDYPNIGYKDHISEEMIWTSFVAKETPQFFATSYLQVFLTAFTLACQEDVDLNNTLFVNYRVSNRFIEDLDSLYMGLFLEAGLGCSDNDYLGSIPSRRTFYLYNGEATDEDCNGHLGFGNAPPTLSVQTVQPFLEPFFAPIKPSLLSFSKDSFPLDLPQSGMEAYHNLNGRWSSNEPMTFGGNGYNPLSTDTTAFMYPENPNEPGSWSEWGEGNLPGERQVLNASGPIELTPSSRNEILYAFTFHPNDGSQNHIEVVDRVYDFLASTSFTTFLLIWDVPYGFECNRTTSILPSPEPPAITLIFPNPTRDILQIELAEAIPSTLQLIHASGELMLEKRIQDTSNQLEVGHLASGIYFLQLQSDREHFVKKIIICN